MCTACIRTKLIINNKEFDKLCKAIVTRDTAVSLHCARFGKIGYLPEATAVRRVLLKSATQGQSLDYYWTFSKQGSDITEYFLQYMDLNEKEVAKLRINIKKNRLNLCYRFRDNKSAKEKFISVFSEIPIEQRTFDMYLKKFGMTNGLVYFFSKVIFFLIYKFKISIKRVSFKKQKFGLSR
jgi:hypothetical protein